MTTKSTDDQTSHLADGDGRAEKPSTLAIALDSSHDAILLRTAIEERVDTLRSLAKKNTDEGYVREGRVITGDADQLADGILPQIEPQTAFEFSPATPENVRLGISNQLFALVRRYVPAAVDADQNPQDAALTELAQRVELFARKVFERAFAAGLAARNATAEKIALDSLTELAGKDGAS